MDDLRVFSAIFVYTITTHFRASCFFSCLCLMVSDYVFWCVLFIYFAVTMPGGFNHWRCSSEIQGSTNHFWGFRSYSYRWTLCKQLPINQWFMGDPKAKKLVAGVLGRKSVVFNSDSASHRCPKRIKQLWSRPNVGWTWSNSSKLRVKTPSNYNYCTWSHDRLPKGGIAWGKHRAVASRWPRDWNLSWGRLIDFRWNSTCC